jgi:hypothetical protein
VRAAVAAGSCGPHRYGRGLPDGEKLGKTACRTGAQTSSNVAAPLHHGDDVAVEETVDSLGPLRDPWAQPTCDGRGGASGVPQARAAASPGQGGRGA